MENLDALEPKTKKFIQSLEAQKGPPLYKMSIEDARNVLNTLQSGKVEKPSAKVEDKKIKGSFGEVTLTIVRPEKSSETLPVVMYFHGGGWILGNKNTHGRLIREIAVGANAAVFFVNYTPSPEAKYPQAIEEAYGATKYVAEHAKEFNVDASKLTVVGDSVGGNMVAAVTLLAKERKGPKISYQAMFYPVTDANFNTGSYKQFAEGPWLTKAAMEWFWNAYAPNVQDRKKITASPLQATLDQLKGLPPALLITDENDVLRDEGEAYAHKLMQAGVEVTAIRYEGTCHDFMMLNPISDTPAVRSAIAAAISHLKKAFSQKTTKLKKAA